MGDLFRQNYRKPLAFRNDERAEFSLMFEEYFDVIFVRDRWSYRGEVIRRHEIAPRNRKASLITDLSGRTEAPTQTRDRE